MNMITDTINIIGNVSRLVYSPAISATAPDIDTPIAPAPIAIPRNNPEISPILEGIISWDNAMVTEKDDQSKNPKIIMERIRNSPWVRRIAMNAGMDANVVKTITFFRPIRSDRAPPDN